MTRIERILRLVLFMSIVSTPLCAQTFQEVFSIGNLESVDENYKWLDVDRDGDYDFLSFGFSLHLYINDGGSFISQTAAGLPPWIQVSVAVADFNNDGNVDLFISGNRGKPGALYPVADIYINNGTGVFYPALVKGLTPLIEGSADCSDFDHDGDADILLTGYNKAGVHRTSVQVNNDNGSFTEMSTAVLAGVEGSYAEWADINGDSFDDIFISSLGATRFIEPAGSVNKFYKNIGEKHAFEEVEVNIPIQGKASLRDVNQDGVVDVFISGWGEGEVPKTGIYSYHYTDVFVALPNGPFEDSRFTSCWGDIDNNGFQDFIGYNEDTGVSNIYLNSNGVFSQLADADFLTGYFVSLGDIESDGDLDILLAGSDGLSELYTIKIFANENTTFNARPKTVQNVDAIPSGNWTRIDWSGTSDEETSQHALRYALRLGTSSSGADIIAPPVSNEGFILSSDALLLYKHGIYLEHLDAGEYYLSVIAVDESMRVSEYSDEITFTVPVLAVYPLPPNQVMVKMLPTDRVEVRWNDASFNEEEFVIERSEDGVAFAPIGLARVNSNIYLDATVLPDHLYYYKVRAKNSNGSSESEVVSIKTFAKGFFVMDTVLRASPDRYNSGHSVACIDYNNDSQLDVFITTGEYGQQLFDNSNGRFKRIESGTLSEFDKMTRISTWGDYDNDGDLDVYLVTAYDRNRLFNNNDGVFTEVLAAPFTTDLNESLSANWVDYDNDGFLDLYVGFNPIPVLYHNNKDGSFAKVPNAFLSLGQTGEAAWCDFDNDGLQDVFIPKFGSKSILMRNAGNGIFENIDNSPVTSVAYAKGAYWVDFDADGDFDLVVNNLTNAADMFFENKGNGIFTAVTNSITESGTMSTGSTWADVDNDGFTDLIVTGSDWSLFMNKGNKNFELTAERSIEDSEALDGVAVASGDYNRDGFLDIVFVSESSDNVFLQNNGSNNHWISFTLEGVKTNRSAIGTIVRIKANDRWQAAFVSSHSGPSSQNSLALEFGLGSVTVIDSVVVEWPGNEKQILINIGADQFMTIKEATDAPMPLPNAPRNLVAEVWDQSVLLNWHANEETNIKNYTIYRSKISDPVTAELITSTTGINYMDMNISEGETYFYWVKAVSSIGESNFSNVAAATVPKIITGIEDGHVITVYPNPTRSKLYVIGLASSFYTFRVMNINGQSILGGTADENGIYLETIRDGLYTLEVNINNELFFCRFVKY